MQCEQLHKHTVEILSQILLLYIILLYCISYLQESGLPDFNIRSGQTWEIDITSFSDYGLFIDHGFDIRPAAAAGIINDSNGIAEIKCLLSAD